MTKPNKKNTAKVKTVEIPEAELANLVTRQREMERRGGASDDTDGTNTWQVTVSTKLTSLVQLLNSLYNT